MLSTSFDALVKRCTALLASLGKTASPPRVHYQDQVVEVLPEETVLDALLREQLPVSYSCKNGQCHSCLLQAEQGTPPAQSQKGLKASQQELGYFLACQCKLEQDLHACPPASKASQAEVAVLSKQTLNPQVIGLALEKPFDFRGGQFINLLINGVSRSYSIASSSDAEQLELHIKHLPEGKASDYVKQSLQPADKVEVQGPFGECFLQTESKQQPLLLSGIGTGLAPLLGIIKDALLQQHQGSIDLVLGARSAEDFYLQEQLAELVEQHPQLKVHHCTLEQGSDIYSYVVEQFTPILQQAQIYLCGAPSFVQKMKKQCFLAGAAMHKIHSDPFTPAS